MAAGAVNYLEILTTAALAIGFTVFITVVGAPVINRVAPRADRLRSGHGMFILGLVLCLGLSVAATFIGIAGVPKGTRLFYSVRHNFGTEMANEGMPLPALANLLGHSDVKMTMRYYNMNKKTIDKARDILNRRAVVNS